MRSGCGWAPVRSRHGEFSREIALPTGTKPEDVEVTRKDGNLEVRILCPTEEAATQTKVPISRK